MKMYMFRTQEQVKPHTESIRGLNLVTVGLMAVHVTNLPL